MIVDLGEYLVVARANGPGADTIESIRCNRQQTADDLADWLAKGYATVRVFHDPPKIGQGRTQ